MKTPDFLIENLYEFNAPEVRIVARSDAARSALSAEVGLGANSVTVRKSYALPWMAKIARWGLSVEAAEDMEEVA
jgi:hypothetical protein